MYWVIALALCVFHLFFLIAYAVFCKSTGHPIHSQAVGHWVLNGLAMVLICTSVIVQRRRFQPWIQTLGVISVIVLALSLVWHLHDSPPIENDYAEKDLLAADSRSYYDLAPFYSDEKRDALQKSLDAIADKEAAPGRTHPALMAWNQVNEYRHTIGQLDRFETIHDLPENATIKLDMPFIDFAHVRSLANVYAGYVQYKLDRGEAAKAIQHLGQLHRVARKGMAGSALLISVHPGL